MSKEDRTHQLHQIAKCYVIEGLGAKNFDAIPYHSDVELRAPINPGGAESPMIGVDNLRSNWWAPLPELVKSTTYVDSYVNEDLSAVTVEFYCDTLQPACRLRIVDRFKVDGTGKITAQENFFDPRALTGLS